MMVVVNGERREEGMDLRRWLSEVRIRSDRMVLLRTIRIIDSLMLRKRRKEKETFGQKHTRCILFCCLQILKLKPQLSNLLPR
jgi:hypothetical protein